MNQHFKKYWRITFILLIGLLVLTEVSAQSPTRIKFARNATAATVSSRLNGFKDSKVFIIKVRPGQTLNVEQIKSEASRHYISISLNDPRGNPASDADASCNSRKEVAPTLAGDYKITVYECQKADEWRGRFRMKITVK